MTKQTGFSSVANSEQEIQNLGLDRDFNIPMREVMVYNPATDELDPMVQPGNEIPTSGNNPSITLSYDGNGNLQYIDEIINTVTYRTTLTYTSGTLTAVSSAVEI